MDTKDKNREEADPRVREDNTATVAASREAREEAERLLKLMLANHRPG